ncbi:phosphatidate cytidylyltransferase [Hydrogenophaga sp. SL48]|jgi:phosphatidate cytidylyltransferase|uniref:phosphatidate cytidylyltransferase n=1 Tax=Hydrogenophaga sp. SL48 TaxID=2806347 RepID=UPI001F429642|nr:phosphatidate cytidylyltransferase [Hydrogenophaga sp. SL48]UJW82923.1 phosphatidate cytidylyltransferase [Hydrogenophaga sp. SL48]
MLKQRIVTALLLLAVLLPAMFYPSMEPFTALSALVMGAAGWEWARLNGCSEWSARLLGGTLGLAVCFFWWWGGLERSWPEVWWAASAAWLVLSVVMLRRGVAGWLSWPAWSRLAGGLVLLACAWLALVQARIVGLGFLLSVLTLVWAADIAAYAGGRAFGRRKLAPTLSPGKSWEGVFSGVLGVCLLGWFWIWFDQRFPAAAPSLFAQLWTASPVWAVVVFVVLAGTSVVGDLLESLVKRGAGMKDSSQLLPGHGGVLDRVDALLPVLPVAMLITSTLKP